MSMISRAWSSDPSPSEWSAPSSISAIPESCWTAPSWRNSASRRRSSCSAEISRSSASCSFSIPRRAAQSIIASRSAIATACVRVSASSFVRMWRTWLLTVSCEMKSRSATSPFESPSASNWRISRSLRREHVALVAAGEELGHQGRVDVALAGRDLLDRAHERAVRRFLQDVSLGAGLEAAAEERALRVGGEDQHLGLGQLLAEQPRRLEPVHPGHADVHDHDVRLASERQLDRALPVGCLAHDPDVRSAREREPEPFAHDFVVVDDQGRDLFRHLTRDCIPGA